MQSTKSVYTAFASRCFLCECKNLFSRSFLLFGDHAGWFHGLFLRIIFSAAIFSRIFLYTLFRRSFLLMHRPSNNFCSSAAHFKLNWNFKCISLFNKRFSILNYLKTMKKNDSLNDVLCNKLIEGNEKWIFFAEDINWIALRYRNQPASKEQTIVVVDCIGCLYVLVTPVIKRATN